MHKYKKIIYGECRFRIEEEFETLEDAKTKGINEVLNNNIKD